MGKITKVKWKSSNLVEWEKQRADMEGVGTGYDYIRIGASDISVIMGTNKWKEKQRLFRHLVGDYSNFQITETTLAGHLLEEITVKRWESWDKDQQISLKQCMAGIRVRHLKKAEFFLLNSDYKNFFISLDYIPDGEQYSPFSGEMYDPLTPHELKHTNWSYYSLWDNGITPAYYDQIQTQMMLTETNLAVFHVLVDGVKYNVMEVERDQKRIDKIKEEVDKFCALVLEGKLAFEGMQTAPTEELRQRFAQVYESILPPFVGSDDAVKLADEIWLPSQAIDKDVNFKKGTEAEEDMMNEYFGFLRLEEQLKINKQKVQATLKVLSSGWEGILTPKYKLINRGDNAVKGRYFSVKQIKEK